MHHEIIGRSRFGKSTYLEHLILQTDGGFAFLDPHGKSAETIADTIPNVIYWEPDTGVTYNPLKNIPQKQRHLAASQLVYAFKAIWHDSWGPRLENILFNSLLLLADNNRSLLDIPKLLTDKMFRTRCLRRASVVEFWEQQFNQWSDKDRTVYIESVLNKVGQFTANPILHSIFSDSTIDLKRVMDKGHRLVINLSKGQLGDEPSHLLGAMLVAGFYNAAQRRDNTTPFTIFADEFQNFATQSFADILSEAGKYGLSLTLCHQYLAQVPKDLIPAIFANVQTITAFRVSADDADFLAREMDMSPAALTDLDKFHAWYKNGFRRIIYTKPPLPTEGRLDANRRHTRAAYTRRSD